MSSEFSEQGKFVSVCTGVVYKMWLLRNGLECQMLVYCGLGEGNVENKKQIKK